MADKQYNDHSDSTRDRPELRIEDAIGGVCLFVLAVSAIVILGLRERDLNQWAKIGDVVGGLFGGLFAFLLALLAALATWWWFKKRDPRTPRLDITHHVAVIEERDNHLILAITASFHNVGETPAMIPMWSLFIHELSPCPTSMMAAISDNKLCTDYVLPWKEEDCIGREIPGHELGNLRVRPSETQRAIAYAMVSNKCKFIRLFSAVVHPDLQQTSDTPRSWGGATVVVLSRVEEGGGYDVETVAEGSSPNSPQAGGRQGDRAAEMESK